MQLAGVAIDRPVGPSDDLPQPFAALLDLPATAQAYLTALAQNLVSAAIRLGPIGQTSGQRVLARMLPLAAGLAAEAQSLGLDDVASATFRADLGSLRHETQYTRLFRS